MRAIKTKKEQMVALIDVYDKLEQIDSGMIPLFGELCCEGLFQNIRSLVIRLIEYNSEKRDLDVESDEWVQLLYETLGSRASSGERAEKLLNEDEIVRAITQKSKSSFR